MNQEEKPDQSTASEDRSCRPTAQGAQDPERHADVSGAATNITRDENKKIDKSAEPLPCEWYQLMCQCYDWTFSIRRDQYRRLDGEWECVIDQEWLVNSPGVNAHYDMLRDGRVERVLGITSKETDLRLAELLARHGAKPTVIFYVIYQLHDHCEGYCTHEPDPHTRRYIKSVVHCVFGLLFEERLSAGLVHLIDKERGIELYRSLSESDYA